MKKQNGFTIIELLIVIVVIAILAAISVVAYNGIQQRARNSQMIAAVQSYKKALMLYATDKNGYPGYETVSTYGVCLGDGYPDDHCWIGDNGDYRVDPALDAALKPYIKSKPLVPAKYYDITPIDSRAGILYFPNNVQRVMIEYHLEGPNQDCKLDVWRPGQTGAQNTVTRCQLILPPLG